jgi:hypothetical protein
MIAKYLQVYGKFQNDENPKLRHQGETEIKKAISKNVCDAAFD